MGAHDMKTTDRFDPQTTVTNTTAASGDSAAHLRTSEWLRTVDRDTRWTIRALHDLQPARNAVVTGAFILIWVAAAATMSAFPNVAVRLAGYAIIGALIHGFAVMMHEGVHGNLIRRPKLDRWLGFLLGVPALVSFSAYRVQHIAHHRYTRTENDPDEIRNFSKRRGLLSLAFYLWLIGGSPWYFLVFVPFRALVVGKPHERRAVLLEYAIMLPLYAAIVAAAMHWGFMGGLIHYWLIPVLFAMFYGNVRGWAEHMLTIPGHPLTETRTVTSNAIVRFLNLNANFHLEHHLFPAMPWYNLAAVHTLLRPRYEQAGAFMYRSYARFFVDACLTGVHGLAPRRAVNRQNAANGAAPGMVSGLNA